VTRRRSTSFGIMPVHLTVAGRNDPLFHGLGDPFYGADFRDWQVVRPDRRALDALGARVLALEKVRPHVPLERSVMAMRLSPEVVALQFHPEADLEGVRRVYFKPERQEWVLRQRDRAKYDEIVARIEDPRYLEPTHRTILPSFLRDAVTRLRPPSGTSVRPPDSAAGR
jgi:GMP synthase-like glutamine amidotransferase